MEISSLWKCGKYCSPCLRIKTEIGHSFVTMEENKEISALFQLIDDPDEEVFGAVTTRIIDYGKGIIPNLENLWENTISEGTQERIELLIHKLHFRDLTEEFTDWKRSTHQDLLTGALLVAKFQYPDLNTGQVFQDVEKLRRNIWLELNSYLTPLEQINVLTSILYNYFNLRGGEVNYQQVDEFLIHRQLESKKGNNIANGILYLILSELLDVPVKAVNIPKQFVLGYFKAEYNFENFAEQPQYKAEFFIDPMSGHVFTHKDVDNYLNRINLPSSPSYFQPISNKKIIQTLLLEFAKCFNAEKQLYKQAELKQLADLIAE